MKPYFKPHDDEGVDRIDLFVRDRFKTSGLSGDEWRYSVVIRFWRKGELVYETSYGRMEWAVAALPYELLTLPEKSKKPMWGLDEKQCAQYGCPETAEVVYRLKQHFSDRGEGPLPDELEAFRAYCGKHKNRGDASREDSMGNYEEITHDG